MNEFLILLYCAGAYNCFKILTGGRQSPSATIAWTIFHLVLPIIAVPLYVLLGDFRIKGYVKKKKATDLSTRKKTFIKYNIIESLDPGTKRQVKIFQKIFSPFGKSFTPVHGRVQLLVDGPETFQSIFESIHMAKSYIFLQYYILRHDKLGVELKNLLILKARSGVSVYLLFDDMGSFWLSKDFLKELTQNGVKVERFLPIASFKRFFQLNFRNHRKMVIVDGRVAFTGGLNVSDEYLIKYGRTATYWRDTHVKISGDAVSYLEECFFKDWAFASGLSVKKWKTILGLKKQNQALPPTPERPEINMDVEDTPESMSPSAVLQIIPTGPADETTLSLLLLLHLINTASKRLWIATPYFVPNEPLVQALELACRRGVDVRVLLPYESDHRLVQAVGLSYAHEMKDMGLKFYQYKKGFMHQKVIVVDDGTSSVGTLNIDNRAIYLNFETTIVVHNRSFNEKISAMLEKDFKDSDPLPLESRMTISRMLGNAARILAPLL